MPAWIHERAEHLLAKNPSMKKSTAFALATQQSHALGKTPKGYGTSKGKQEAKSKFDKPKKEYVKSSNPGDLETPKLSDKPKTEWTGRHLVKKEASLSPIAVAAMREELTLIKQAGMVTSFLSKFSPKPVAHLSSGALQAHGVAKQMAKGRSYGGAAVDPFVKMRQQAAAARRV